ncbi:hypothetical protein [Haliangium sp.]|uniref:hypothetical protein n=1 Tax=Haliangium sp. TaxID=2663208 RepID=UPI003D0D5B40
MDDTLRDKFRARLNAPAEPPLKATRSFLQSYVADRETLAEVESEIAHMVTINPRTLHAGLAGIEGLIANPPAEEGTLSQLVAWEIGWVLDDPSDAGALSWLGELAKLLRKHLGDS